MLRLLSKDDIKEEWRDIVTKMIQCPSLGRHHTLLMCFTCSKFTSCEIPAEHNVNHLTAEDVMIDAASLKKSLAAKAVKEIAGNAAASGKRKRKTKAKKTRSKSVVEGAVGNEEILEESQLPLESSSSGEKTSDEELNLEEEKVTEESTVEDRFESQVESRLDSNVESRSETPKKRKRGAALNKIIKYLEDHPNATVKEVARECSVSYTYALKTLRRLNDERK